jgi:hypothetical protein
MPEPDTPSPPAPTHQLSTRGPCFVTASTGSWCSAAWFERTAPAAMVKSIYRFKWDSVRVPDDYDAAPEW